MSPTMALPLRAPALATHSSAGRAAVIGAGIAGAACAAGLRQAGLEVTVFDKSRGVGGRMSTRRVPAGAVDGQPTALAFDHGTQGFEARHPRFRAMLRHAQAAGAVTPWQLRVHAPWPAPAHRELWVGMPDMPALARHLLQGADLRLSQAVVSLRRTGQAWRLVDAQEQVHGPFDVVVLAIPAVQAAELLKGVHGAWSQALNTGVLAPCWTLMAMTQDVDWPWDATEPAQGPLAWVTRGDRRPGRTAPAGQACWVAQARADWSLQHLEDSPAEVQAALCRALGNLLPGHVTPVWHHAQVHRWRHALVDADAHGRVDPFSVAIQPGADGLLDAWWDPVRGLGVCGDHIAGGLVEAAWRSGDELADAIAASLETPATTDQRAAA